MSHHLECMCYTRAQLYRARAIVAQLVKLAMAELGMHGNPEPGAVAPASVQSSGSVDQAWGLVASSGTHSTQLISR
jgi:hypothetical protein